MEDVQGLWLILAGPPIASANSKYYVPPIGALMEMNQDQAIDVEILEDIANQADIPRACAFFTKSTVAAK